MLILKQLIASTVLVFTLSHVYADSLPPVFSKSYTDTHSNPPSFKKNRKDFTCTTWQPPKPDPMADRWYKAVGIINGKESNRSPEEFKQMLILLEGAARKGHHKAIKDLIIVYASSSGTMKGLFTEQPEKGRYWLHYALDQGWPSAYEWLSLAMVDGDLGYPRNEKLSLAYLQKAAEMGGASAQYEMAKVYGKLEEKKMRDILMVCAAQQGFGPAIKNTADLQRIRNNSKQALQLYHEILMVGGGFKNVDSSSFASVILEEAFKGNKRTQQELNTDIDLERTKAYGEISTALIGEKGNSGNPFLTFPKINEVLPLPPAKMPPWKGIYSAMSDEDAKFYRNPPSFETLAAEIKAAGVMVPAGYIPAKLNVVY